MKEFMSYLLILSFIPPLCVSSVISSADKEGGSTALTSNLSQENSSKDSKVNEKDILPSAIVCEYYNATCISEASEAARDVSHCFGNQTCPRDSPHNCYVVWKNRITSNGTNTTSTTFAHRSGHDIKMMGCLLKSDDCHSNEECVENDTSEEGRGHHLFCCCRGDLCNSKFSWSPKLPNSGTEEDDEPEERPVKPWSPYTLTTFVILGTIMLVSVILAIWCVYKKRKAAQDLLMHDNEIEMQSGTNPSSLKLLEKRIDLQDLLAEGRYGKVWKANLGDDIVAVKVFSPQDRQSWQSEQEVYKLPRMSHENILKFIGLYISGEGLNADFWLVTEFHEKGSLCDFLKHNTVTWSEMCKIGYSIACGLSHLHEEIPGKNNTEVKVAVAHRDFKSKNVLIKSDLTACIGDFGLALIFEPGKPVGDTHGQVGTRRYMAPEVLECAITFSRDSFIRIDMYACGLVLWELASRCDMSGITPKEYSLPFDDMISQPNLEQMRELVVYKKLRPPVPDNWTSNPCMAEWTTMVSDCWDQDAEARLSASNVRERIKGMRELAESSADMDHNDSSAVETTPLITNNLPSSPVATNDRTQNGDVSSMSVSHPDT